MKMYKYSRQRNANG